MNHTIPKVDQDALRPSISGEESHTGDRFTVTLAYLIRSACGV